MEFKNVLSTLLKKFREKEIRYGLMGGFALGLWGVGRATVDLDFLVDRSDQKKVGKIMAEIGYECKFMSENVSQYVSPLKTYGEIDFLHAFRQASLEMLGRAEGKEIFGGELNIMVVRPEDLIGLKLQAVKNNPARKEQDMSDIKALIAVQREKIDWQLIKKYANILDAEDLLKELNEK